MSDVTKFFADLYELLRHEQLWAPLAVVLPVCILTGFWVGRWFPRNSAVPLPPHAPAPPPPPVSTLEPIPEAPGLAPGVPTLDLKSSELEIKIGRARSAIASDGPGLWLAIPPGCPPNYKEIKSSIPIYTLANLKGGVGKTTLAAGLGAYFANPFGVTNRKRERVLLIDLDYQGSLSSMALSAHVRVPAKGTPSRAARLLSGCCTGSELIHMHQRVLGLDQIPNGDKVELYAIPAYYDLAQAENRLMIEWLIGDTDGDIRYNLAKVLLSEEVQRTYDRIIIDAPPRLTTAHIQALCASTHVLVPTILDHLSGEAVGGFVEQIIINRELWPFLKIIGIVGSMTQLGQDQDLRPHEKEGLLAIQEAVNQKIDAYHLRSPAIKLLPRDCFIPDRTALARAAGQRIAYLVPGADTAGVRQDFDRLGKKLVEYINHTTLLYATELV